MFTPLKSLQLKSHIDSEYEMVITMILSMYVCTSGC